MTTKNTKVTADEVLRRAQDLHEDIRAWRREIHRYPELTFTEQRTAGLVNSVLVDREIETETEVAKTGVVGHIRGGSGPVVALRADMDALPIQEINGTDYDSTRPGIMHACGHDAHTAMLLGAAAILKQLADAGQLPGSIRLLFQPSEEAQDREGKSGGMRMVEEGALTGRRCRFWPPRRCAARRRPCRHTPGADDGGSRYVQAGHSRLRRSRRTAAKHD